MPEVRTDGSKGLLQESNPDLMGVLLKQDGIQRVEIFIPKRGMVIQVENEDYTIIAVSQKGMITLRPVNKG